MSKTNAVRLLEASNVEHETIEYETADEAIDAVSVADAIGVERDRVFKTLVARGDKTGVVVFVLPGPSELNLKKAAPASGNKKLELVSVKELLPLTGYIRGGCSPIGMKKRYPTFIDETAQLFDTIFVSAGVRGMQIRLAPDALLHEIEAVYADVI